MSRKRTWIGLFLLIWLWVLSNASVSLAAQTTDGFTYTEGGGVVTITGYSGVSTVDIGASFPDATEIVIADRAFDGATIVSVAIPKNVTSIGEYAFADCDSLQTVTFEERTTEPLVFEGRTFNYCSNLLALDIPDTVTAIPYYFAVGCTSLGSVELPSSCYSIGTHAFDGCEVLKSITIPANCNTISEDAFNDCEGLATVDFDDRADVTTEFVLGESAFDGCKALTSIALPENCKTVAYHAFSSCTSLVSVVLPDTCESIGGTAFYGCSALERMNSEEAGKVVLPSSCQTVGESAFSYCTSISKLYVQKSCARIDDGAFNGCTGLSLLSFENPNTVIGTNALPTTNTSNITIYCNGDGNVINYYEGDTNITIVNTFSLTLDITQLPTKTEYHYAEKGTLDVSGLKLMATRTENDSTTQEEVAISDCLISGFVSDKVGEQTITVSYGGKTVTFKVSVYYNLANAIVEVDNATYTGVRVQPYMTVTGKETGTALIINKDYVVSYSNNLNVGNATATISGMGVYKGEKEVSFKVLRKTINEANTTIVVANMDYTGNQVRPVPEVACGTEPLILDEDYVVTYGTNINVGKGFVIVEGIGNYEGTIKKWFNINAVSSEDDGTSSDDKENSEDNETSDSNDTDNDGTASGGTGEDGNPSDGTEGTVPPETPSTEAPSTEAPSTEAPSTEASKPETPQKGKTYTYKNMRYKVTGSNTVTFMKPVNKKVKKITIPSKVKILGKSFKVTKINKKACYNCKNLTTVTIGNNVTDIGDQAFAKCSNLKKVTIGKGLKKIGKKVFYKDSKLKKLTIKSAKLTSVGKGALKGVKGVKIWAPKKKLKKYKKLFKKAE